MKLVYALLLCAVLSSSSYALPTQSTHLDYASEASKIIATNLLKSYKDIDSNQAHSPLGITTILAVLAEGAAGETYEEFGKVFGYPKERSGLRASFKQLLGKYQNREYGVEPSFQTWLYIYRNFSARSEFKALVHDNYFVDVKDINRDEYDWSAPNTSLDELDATASNSKDVIGFETLKRLKVDDDDDEAQNDAAGQDTYGEEVLDKESSKFDRFVDDKQYVEKPAILAEIQQTTAETATEAQETELETVQPEAEMSLASDDADTDAKQQSKREEELNMEENEIVHENEKLHKNNNNADVVIPIADVLKSNEPQKVTLPLENLKSVVDQATKSDSEIMMVLESHLREVARVYGGRSLFQKDDITSGLSANSITGRELNTKTKMLLFNGLYYRGNWQQPFFELKDSDNDFFFMTSEDAEKVPMMHGKGKYHYADVPHLNAKAICVPYENNNYTMMLLVPDEIEGLHGLIDKLQPTDFKQIRANAQLRELSLTLPKFQVEETSRSESMLKSLGLQKLFSRTQADLSRLSDDTDLHVDEIVQFVNVRVDEGSSSSNVYTAATTLARNGGTFEAFEVNRPFLYFIMDCDNEFVIASGKVYAPEFKEEKPISIEVELEQA